MNKLTASIVITTRNRKEDLCRAIDSCLAQKGRPEILIFDDGSDDGTEVLVRDRYPGVLLHRQERSEGLIAARTRAASLVTGDIIVSIDDDAVFSDASICEEALQCFSDPCIGAVAISQVDVLRGPDVINCAPDDKAVYVTSEFIGTAHALRRDLFLTLKGYRNYFVRQCEEMDYCLRLLDQGYFVRVGASKPILHYVCPKRKDPSILYFSARNNILFTLQNVPMPHALGHVTVNIFNLLRKNKGDLGPVVKGILGGFRDFIQNSEISRSPVSRKTYRTFRRLRRKGVIRLNAVWK